MSAQLSEDQKLLILLEVQQRLHTSVQEVLEAFGIDPTYALILTNATTREVSSTLSGLLDTYSLARNIIEAPPIVPGVANAVTISTLYNALTGCEILPGSGFASIPSKLEVTIEGKRVLEISRVKGTYRLKLEGRKNVMICNSFDVAYIVNLPT